MWKGAVKKGQTDVISVTMHFVMQAIYRSMWQITAVKGQTIVTSVTMHLFMQSIYRNIWKRTAEKGQTNATSMHAIWKKHLQWRKSNKCNQCNYESSQGWNLKTPFKIHSGEKPNKCNQCGYASSESGYSRKRLKGHSGERQSSVTTVTLHPCGQTPWRNTWKCTLKFDIKKTN